MLVLTLAQIERLATMMGTMIAREATGEDAVYTTLAEQSVKYRSQFINILSSVAMNTDVDPKVEAYIQNYEVLQCLSRANSESAAQLGGDAAKDKGAGANPRRNKRKYVSKTPEVEHQSEAGEGPRSRSRSRTASGNTRCYGAEYSDDENVC